MEIDYDLLVSRCVLPEKQTLPPLGDFHSANAIAFYGRDVIEKAYKTDYATYKDFYRDNAKKNGLGLCYGGSYKMLQSGLGVSEPQAKKIHSSFFETLSGFKKHIEATEKQAREDLFTKNLFGRLLYLPEFGEKEPFIQSKGRRNMFNYPIQSISADLIKLALLQAMKLSETAETNVFANNNIHEAYYNRIVSLPQAKVTEELTTLLETLPTGNVLVVVTNDEGEYIEQFDRPLSLTTEIIDKFNLVLEF